ncbi:MAG: VacJ family lipoprotein, partial [Hyphomicrobiales bacterium]|nr:VacJ family lipoprotein [Hyphomicrobiales bacterium]
RATRILEGLAALSLTLLAGCASVPHDPMAQINDPNEAVNRKMLAVNQAVFGPVSSAYHATPSLAREALGNVSSNLNEPRIFANDLLQGRIAAGATTFGRFVLNSTFGVAGLFDIASANGLPKQTGDFGETMSVWGVGDGPYFVSPLLGPSTVRDTFGFVVDQVADPVGVALSITWGLPASLGVGSIDFVSQVDRLKQAQDSSIDFYSFLRSAYYQNRRAQLRQAAGLPLSVETPADVDGDAPPPPAPKAKPKKPHKAQTTQAAAQAPAQ